MSRWILISINQSINKFIAGNKAHKHTDTRTNRKTHTHTHTHTYRNREIKRQVPRDTNVHTQNTNQHSIQMSCFIWLHCNVEPRCLTMVLGQLHQAEWAKALLLCTTVLKLGPSVTSPYATPPYYILFCTVSKKLPRATPPYGCGGLCGPLYTQSTRMTNRQTGIMTS